MKVLQQAKYFRVNYYIPDEENSDGYEDAADFYCKASSEVEAEESLLKVTPEAEGVTTEEVSEAEYLENAADDLESSSTLKMAPSIGQWATWTPRNPMCSSVTGEVLALDGGTVVLLPEASAGQQPRPLHRSLATGSLAAASAPAQ
ncbi:hypothetical protein [Azonexus hydrophilus]|uniref:Uncharacterized protein n=1 Tax=Azonexus hydrophilus TaxID=418702 RepID=A0ABZ2XMU6_9RHOO